MSFHVSRRTGTLPFALAGWLLFRMTGAGFAQSAAAGSLPPNDPLCGFQGNHFYLDADKMKRGLGVDLIVGDAIALRPTTLRFLVSDKPHGLPADDLQVEHEKLLHVIGVREDLSGFFHVHPVKTGPGQWAVSHTFTNAGRYKIWSDVKYRGISYSFAQPMLTVGGASDPGVAPAEANPAASAGYELQFSHSDPLIAGGTNRLEFSIRDAAGKPVWTEKFLGAAMHLVIVRHDLTVFLHAHPEQHEVTVPRVSFRQVFPQPGEYRLFVQYRPANAGLAPDDALLARFDVKVAAAR